MTSTGAAALNRPRRAHSHSHLWSLPDGTGLHAPHGELVVESGTGQVCCHLCGRWYVSLGGHVRAHGHTADTYRAVMGLCRTRPLVSEAEGTKLRREIDAAGIAVRSSATSDRQGCVTEAIAR